MRYNNKLWGISPSFSESDAKKINLEVSSKICPSRGTAVLYSFANSIANCSGLCEHRRSRRVEFSVCAVVNSSVPHHASLLYTLIIFLVRSQLASSDIFVPPIGKGIRDSSYQYPWSSLAIYKILRELFFFRIRPSSTLVELILSRVRTTRRMAAAVVVYRILMSFNHFNSAKDDFVFF